MAYQPINLRTMAMKVEGTPGTYDAPGDADFDVRVRSIEVTPNIEPDDEASKYQTGDHGEDETIMGSQSATITASVKLCGSGSYDTEPNWFKWARACGVDVVDYSTTGMGLVARKAKDLVPYSIVVADVERGASPVTTLYQFSGAMGNMVVGAEGVGKPVMGQFTFQGSLEDIVDGTALDLTAPDTTTAETFISSAATIFGSAHCFSSFQFDIGNTVQGVPCQSAATGFKYFGITNRQPRLSANPLAQKQATDDVLATVLAETTGVISIPTSEHFTLKVLKGQMLPPALASREGLVNWDQNYKALKNGTTGSLADSALTPEDTWEFLFGARA